MKYYKTRSWGFKIETVEVERVTEQSVYINGQRNAIRGNHCNFFPTWQEAKQHYIGTVKAKIEATERMLQDLEADLVEAENLAPEDGNVD